MIAIREDHWNSLVSANNPQFMIWQDVYTIHIAMDILVTNMSHYPLRDHDAEVAIMPHNGQSALIFARVKFDTPSEYEIIKERSVKK
jgi:hypothetical protein